MDFRIVKVMKEIKSKIMNEDVFRETVEQEKGSNMAYEIKKTQKAAVKLTKYSNFCHFLRQIKDMGFIWKGTSVKMVTNHLLIGFKSQSTR